MKRILLVGGGTGGHIYPLIAVARELQKLGSEKGVNLELMALADSNFWKREFESRGVRFKRIFAPKLRLVEGGRLNFFAFLAVPLTLLQALWIIFVFMPDLVFSKGSFTSIMPSLISRLYFIPVFVHESDSVPGRANRFIAKLTKKVFISFESSASYFKSGRTILTGNPIRENLLSGNRTEASGYFNLDPNRKTILFLAGSQGSKFINDLVISSLVELTRELQIIHQAGPVNFESVSQEIEKIKKEGEATYGSEIEKDYRIFPFLNEEELKNAYALSDLIISRSGSNIFEIAALGKPAIVIPYPYSAGGHQQANAGEIAKFGAVVLEEENLKPHILIDQIMHLLDNQSVGERIRQFAKLDASKIIAQELISHL